MRIQERKQESVQTGSVFTTVTYTSGATRCPCQCFPPRWLCLSRWPLRPRQPHGWLVHEFYIALPTTLIIQHLTCILFAMETIAWWIY
jgi:hypothetical protein